MRWSLPLLALLSELAADETLTLDVELPAPVAPDGLAACSLDVQIRAGHTQTITLRTTSSFHMALAAAERFARAHNLTHGHGCETCACVAHVLVEVIAEQCPSICAHARCDELRALEASDKKLLVAYGNCQASAIATAVRRVGGAAFDAEWDVHVITPVQSVSRAELRASGAGERSQQGTFHLHKGTFGAGVGDVASHFLTCNSTVETKVACPDRKLGFRVRV